jgi:gluconolactonase
MSNPTATPAPAVRLEHVAGVDAHEGPVYVPDEHALYFTSLPAGPERRVAIRRLDLGSGRVTTLRDPANGANGMTLGPDGRLLVCEQGSMAAPARIARVDRNTGAAATVVDTFEGRRLNSPNDVVARSDGSIWFTDPSYGFLQGFRPPPETGDNVYRLDPAAGDLRVVANSLDKPNGLAFSPDESVLYVTDSGANQEEGSFYPERPHHIRAFDVTGDGLVRERVFADVAPGFPDGIKCDAAGRVYASCASGVQVFGASGERLGEIPLPGAVNFTWGGPDRDLLLITTDTAVWAAASIGA